MNDRDRLIDLFKKTEYTPFPKMTIKSNLGNQFTDYALNCIVDELLANGVIVPPCKVGDTVYEFGCTDPFEDPLDLYVVESTVSGIAIFTTEDIHNMNCFGKTVFLTKEEAERALKERKK